MARKINVVCCECVFPISDCPWLSNSKPVPGWNAEVVPFPINNNKGQILTYHVESCPLFKPHPRSIMFDSEGRQIRASYH